MKISLLRNSLVAASLLFSTMTLALDLDEAKQNGWVGEKNNGYLGLIVAQQGVQALVDDVNHKRQLIYSDLASKNKLDLEQVEKLAAQKAYAKTLTGHYLWVDGAWVKK
ncbi:YdbL family protein [Paraglaciecola sp.]|uniref:YdbL family protein n=1 Tax=Paraglaciecola sp. TaxID=1920173 RepID=UPI0030F390CB